MSDRQTRDAEAMRDRRASERELSARKATVAAPTVQVPVSLIERIDSAYNASAETLAALIEQLWMLSQSTPSAEAMGQYVQVAGRTLCVVCWQFDGTHIEVPGVLHEPTPSAEPIPAHCANLHPHAAHDYNPDTLRHHAMRHCSGEGTKPPRIADMVRGRPIVICTCGHAESEHWGPGRACTMVDCGCTHPVHKEFSDPSTIRDATPPTVTTDGDRRG